MSSWRNQIRTWSRGRRFIVAVLLLAAAMAWMIHIVIRSRTPRRRLIATGDHLTYRLAEPRLQGFAYKAFAAPTRSVDGNQGRGSLAFSAGVEEILSEIEDSDEPTAAYDRGVAHLMLGRDRQALEQLERAVVSEPDNAAVWSDLGAARYEYSRSHDDPYLLVEAMAAVTRALSIQQDSAVSNFNAGLIYAAMGLREPAIAAFNRSASLDHSAGAAEAARRAALLREPTLNQEWEHLRHSLESAAIAGDHESVARIVRTYPQQARTWCETIYPRDWAVAFERGERAGAEKQIQVMSSVADALARLNGETMLKDSIAIIRASDGARTQRLAHAYMRYYDARILYGKRDVTAALEALSQAAGEFREGESPFVAVVESYIASALFDVGRTEESENLCNHLLKSSTHGHRALRAQLLWTLGNIQVRRGLFVQALGSQRDSLRIFRESGEELNTCALTRLIAGSLAVLGRPVGACRVRFECFARASRLGERSDLQASLDSAARAEAFNEHWETALPFLSLAAEMHDENPRVYASSLVWLALAQQHEGVTAAAGQLDYAARAVSMIRDPVMRARAKADLSLVEAIEQTPRDATRAIALVDDYLRDAATAQIRFYVPEAYVQRAIAHRELGQMDAAENDLRAALRFLTDRRSTGREDPANYFRTSEVATNAVVDLMVRRGAVADAMSLLDDYRAAAFGSSSAVQTVADGGHEPVIEYLALPKTLLIFVADSQGVRATYVNVGERELRAAVREFVADVISNRDRESAAGTRLSQWLVSPVADAFSQTSLFIVPDRAMTGLPFGALRNGDHYVNEDSEIVFCRSRLLAFHRAVSSPDTVVAVGNPLSDETFDLPPLPNGAHEATVVALTYPHAALLTGRDATPANLLRVARPAQVVHIVAHAVVVPNESRRSCLILSSDGRRSTLSIDYSKGRMLEASRAVVLAGCQTAAAPDGVGRGWSLAEGFLGAGASTVVGTLWDVPDDQIAEEFSVHFHETLRRGISPGAAARAAQLQMLRSPDPGFRGASSWSVFQVYGSD